MKAILALVMCLIAAGAQGSSPSAADLVGQWRYADGVQRCDYLFNRDGSFSGQVVDRGKLISKFTGHWHVAGGTLFYRYVTDDLKRIAAGATDRDKLLKVDAESFVIEAADGSKRRYWRVR